jgi:hypothetical protein
MKFDVEELKKFLVEAKMGTYASGGGEVSPQRSGFKELEYRKGRWYYRDSYSGYFQAPGMEVVYFKDEPVWTMAYGGKVHEEFYGKTDDTYAFFEESYVESPGRIPIPRSKKF